MKIILQEKIINLGQVGDQVNVKPGYARNYLIPNGMAALATANNIAAFEKRRAELEKRSAEIPAQARARAEKLADVAVKIPAQAGEEGKLFGSITARDVATAVTEAGYELKKSEVKMPEGPIRNIGEYEIGIQLHGEVNSTVKVIVVAA